MELLKLDRLVGLGADPSTNVLRAYTDLGIFDFSEAYFRKLCGDIPYSFGVKRKLATQEDTTFLADFNHTKDSHRKYIAYQVDNMRPINNFCTKNYLYYLLAELSQGVVDNGTILFLISSKKFVRDWRKVLSTTFNQAMVADHRNLLTMGELERLNSTTRLIYLHDLHTAFLSFASEWNLPVPKELLATNAGMGTAYKKSTFMVDFARLSPNSNNLVLRYGNEKSVKVPIEEFALLSKTEIFNKFKSLNLGDAVFTLALTFVIHAKIVSKTRPNLIQELKKESRKQATLQKTF